MLALIRGELAEMDGRIDPPSSMHRLTEADARAQVAAGEVRVIGPATAPLACVFFSHTPDALYIG